MNLPHKESSLSYDFLEGEGTFFRTQSTVIKESISKELFDTFCKLNNDEERVKFMYNIDIIHSIELPASPFNKNTEKSLNFKNQGNTYFGSEKYIDAIKFYGFALIECPTNEVVLLSTIYANRSAAFYYTKEYKFALTDINLCLTLSYPKNLEHKVQERKARCYLALNDLKNALNTFKTALKSLDQSNLNQQTRQKKENDFTIMIAMLTKTLSEKTPTKLDICTKSILPTVPNLTSKQNKKFPNASDLVRIEQNEIEGKFAVADRMIEPGNVLLVEQAHCANLLFDYSKTHCQHCFIRVIYLIPCPNCPNVIFCSIKCRNNAYNCYHKYECSFLGSLWTCGSSIVCHLAVRLITQHKLDYFSQIQPKLGYDSLNTKYDSSSYNTVYNLCRHDNERSHLDFFQRTVMAVVLLKFLQNSKYFSEESNSNNKLTDVELFIGGLLLRNLQILQFNAHEIAELQYNPDFPGDLDRAKSQFIGGGLFPTLALFNHSCEPGIVRYFSGSNVVVKSVKSIRAGEIIAENYGPIYTEVPRAERKRELKTRYWFECNCIPCMENWPMFDEMKTDVIPFRCVKSKNCLGVVSVSVNTDEFMFPCPKCKEMIYIFASLKGLNETEAMFKKGENFIKNQLYKEALDVFIRILKLLDSILKPPYKDFCLCQQKIRSAMLTFGNVHNQIKK